MRSPGPLPSGDLARARSVILRHGWNAAAYQILNPGIDLWFPAGREAVVGHSDRGKVSVVAGAPVCAEAELAAVAAEYEAAAAARGRAVCYFGAGARLERLAGPGYARVRIGSQPVWDPAAWPAVLSASPSLRAQLSRARNKGVTVREIVPEDAPGLRDCLEEWLRGRGMPAMHFLIEPATLGRLWDRRVFAAERAGRIVGYLVASPVPARGGWLVEQIVRGRSAPNGVSELLVDAAFRAAAAAGIGYFTLGLAPLSRLAPPSGGPGAEKRPNPLWLDLVFDWARAHGGRFYNFRGLERFKAKLGPSHWEPIYALCNRERFSPRILLAIAAVFGGDSPLRFLGRMAFHALRQEAARLARIGRKRGGRGGPPR